MLGHNVGRSSRLGQESISTVIGVLMDPSMHTVLPSPIIEIAEAIIMVKLIFFISHHHQDYLDAHPNRILLAAAL